MYVLRQCGKKTDQEALWEGIRADEIDFIGTDHCSFLFKGQKDYFGTEDYSKIPNGLPGVEHRGVLLYTYGVAEGRITKEQMVKQLSENPARMFGMFPRKGILAEGSDADIVVIDPQKGGQITAQVQVQNVDYTPYEGMKTACTIEAVYLRGHLTVQNGIIQTEKKGKYISRGRANEAN